MIRFFAITLCFITIIGTFITLPHSAMASSGDKVIGHVTAIEGSAALSRNGKAPSSVSNGASIYIGDILETQNDAKLMISFIDQSKLTIGNNARLLIDEYIYSGDLPDTNKARFSMLRGAFEFVSGLIAKEQETPDVQFQTTYGSIGIRGTVFWGGIIERKSSYDDKSRMAGSAPQFGVYVKEGAVDVVAKNGTVRVDEGYGTFMKTPDSRPSHPKIWTANEISKAAETVAFNNKP